MQKMKPTKYASRDFDLDGFAKRFLKAHALIKIDGQLYTYADGVYKYDIESIHRELIKVLQGVPNRQRKEIIDYVTLLIEQDADITKDLDKIAFANGIYDLTDGVLKEYNPAYYITNKIPWNYDPEAHSPILDKFFDDITEGDAAIRANLEEMIGYCFYRANRLGTLFILYGPKANGKSTLQNMINRLLGRENTTAVDLGDLAQPFSVSQLYGKLLDNGDDINSAYVDDSSVIKKVATGGRLTANQKYVQQFDFTPYAKMIFSANDIPRMRDRTGAVARRMRIIPLTRSFGPGIEGFDPNIDDKLSGSEVMSALINIGLAGLQRLLAHNAFTPSDKIDAQLEDYKTTNNGVLQWLEDEYGVINPDIQIAGRTTELVYGAYKTWTLESGTKTMSKVEFGKVLAATFGIRSKTKREGSEMKRIYVADTDKTDTDDTDETTPDPPSYLRIKHIGDTIDTANAFDEEEVII